MANSIYLAQPIPSILLDTMPAAGADGLIEIPIAITGAWKRGEAEFSITKEDLARMAANFKRRKNGEINVDYDHASEMPEVARGGPVPSAGRILKLRSNGALYAGIEFTARALELIKNREYRFVSPAIAWGVKDKTTGDDQGTTLTSLALTNRPFLEDLPPIKLSEIGSEGSGARVGTGATMSATTELIALARGRARDDGVSFAEALCRIGREHPALVNAHREAALKSPPTISFGVPVEEACNPGPVAAELMRLAKAKAAREGVRLSEALVAVAREKPLLAHEYRCEVMGVKF